MIRKLAIFCLSLLAFLAAVTPIDTDPKPIPALVPGVTDTALEQLQSAVREPFRQWIDMIVQHNNERMEEIEEEARE